MITGIGTDIIEISRFHTIISNVHFMERVFTEYECGYIANQAQRAAGMFGAKEAFSKAVGTGLSGFSLKDVEIRHDKRGKPYFVLYNAALEKFGKLNLCLSISHCDCHAVAFVTASEKEKDYENCNCK